MANYEQIGSLDVVRSSEMIGKDLIIAGYRCRMELIEKAIAKGLEP